MLSKKAVSNRVSTFFLQLIGSQTVESMDIEEGGGKDHENTSYSNSSCSSSKKDNSFSSKATNAVKKAKTKVKAKVNGETAVVSSASSNNLNKVASPDTNDLEVIVKHTQTPPQCAVTAKCMTATSSTSPSQKLPSESNSPENPCLPNQVTSHYQKKNSR